MCHNKDLFTRFVVLAKPNTVTLPNGRCVSVTHAGTVILNKSLVLHGVLYIPSFRYNLLSVSKLSHQQGSYVVFTPEYCFMQAPSMRRPQVLDNHFAGLYLLQLSLATRTEIPDKKDFQISFQDSSKTVCNARMSDVDI